MQWWQVKIDIAREAVDALAAVLQAWPEVQGVMIENDAADGPPHPEFGEFLDDRLLQTTEETSVTVYLPHTMPEAEVRGRIHQAIGSVAAGMGLGAADRIPVDVSVVEESAWANAWQQEFAPVAIGASWMIVPKWLQPTWTAEPGRIPIFLEPGRAFGTGMHATTQLCLQALEAIDISAKQVLDVGCGTGILSIAAAKRGAGHVLAVDLDPVAVAAATENIADNGASNAVDVTVGDLLHGVGNGPYELVLANILRDPVYALTPDAFARLSPGGRFISSGYLTAHAAGVHERLQSVGFMIERTLHQSDWIATVAVKP